MGVDAAFAGDGVKERVRQRVADAYGMIMSKA
jgi:hypothetical protein